MEEITKSGLEDLEKGTDVQNGSGDATKAGGASGGSGTEPQSNGAWISALPKEMREGVKAEEYANLNEYIKSLQEAVRASAREESVDTEKWDSFIGELEESGAGIPEPILKAFRDGKVPADAAKGVMKAMNEYGLSVIDRQRQELAAYVAESWKGKFQEMNEKMKDGMRIFAKSHPEMLKEAQDTGLLFSKPYVTLLIELAEQGRGTPREKSSPEGTPTPKEDPDNPFGLRNL